MLRCAFYNFLLLSIFIISFGCEGNESVNVCNYQSTKPLKIDDGNWVVNNQYSYGDIRRYGFENRDLSKPQIDSIFEIASAGVSIVFPEGYYPINLIIEDRKNLDVEFRSVTFAGKVELLGVYNSNFKGELRVLDLLYIKDSKKIKFENVKILTDTLRNINLVSNRGLNIYSGSECIDFDTIYIANSGGEGDFFKYSQAAFLLHGYNDPPKYISAGSIEIYNSKRSAAYISGYGHKLKTILISNYGLTSGSSNLKPIERASNGEEKCYSGFWLNYSENVVIDTLKIKNKCDFGVYSLWLDESSGVIPNIIQNLNLVDNNNYNVDFNSNTLILNEL